MISPTDLITTKPADVWSRLSAPLPQDAIMWRQDGKVISRDGRFFARFVAYVDANTVRERLDSVVPGEWDLTLELLPSLPGLDDGESAACSFRARLQILGVIREDVGMGRDYKQAATDAFKRAAVRFGIAHELYAYEQNWVEMDGEGRFAKPLQDPQQAYERRLARREGAPNFTVRDEAPAGRSSAKRTTSAAASSGTPAASTTPGSTADAPACPKCGGRMWDNRLSKRNPNAPDFRCRNRGCDGVIWPTRLEPVQPASTPSTPTQTSSNAGASPGAPDTGPLIPFDDVA
jgi:hypothetical protein